MSKNTKDNAFEQARENVERGRPGMEEQHRPNSSANDGVMPNSGSQGSSPDTRARGDRGKSNR